MATARCYTKSGSVEKYESNLWKSPTAGNWSSFGVLGTITTPDSNGNYTVTPANNFEDSNTQTEFYCYTMYGGVRKTFYFKESINYIYLSSNIQFSSIGMNVYLSFTNNEYLGNDRLSVRVEITTSNPLTLIDSAFFIVSKNSKSPLERIIKIEDTGKRYNVEITSCKPMSGNNYQVYYKS